MQRRLTVFARGTDGYRLARTIPVDIGIRSMCYLGENLVVNGLALGDPHRTAAQIDAKEPVTDIQTIIIDPRTGAASLSGAAWPRLGAVSGNRAILFFEDPAPRLEIRELRRP